MNFETERINLLPTIKFVKDKFVGVGVYDDPNAVQSKPPETIVGAIHESPDGGTFVNVPYDSHGRRVEIYKKVESI